jgi:hypothetical protein
MNTAIELKINDLLGTIREERQRLNQLEAACVTLLEVQGSGLEVQSRKTPTAARIVRLPGVQLNAPVGKGTKSPEGTKGTQATKPSGASAPTGIGKRVGAVVEEIVGEFDIAKVHADLPGEPYETVRSAVGYLLKKGCIEAVRRGVYRNLPVSGKVAVPDKARGRPAKGVASATSNQLLKEIHGEIESGKKSNED